MRCIVATWSAHSVDADWVRAETAGPKEHDKLASIMMDGKFSLPIRFYHVHTHRLADWEGSRKAAAFRKLAQDIPTVTGAPMC